MDIEKMVKAVKLCGSTPKVDQCKQCTYWAGGDMSKCIPRMTLDAATALSTLQAENEKLRAELERVKAEKAKAIESLSENLRAAYQSRDAAVEDMAEMIGDIEEIRRGYGVDNDDANSAFAGLCGNYCVNNGHFCYEESENYRCKHFKWRGMVKED